ncbi:CDCA3 protein, partial [Grus americana]|nr:CDCA3 protein [Grus americana]
MGVSGSAPATPAALRNKHLAHVTDPRSPSAGILRTPIEPGSAEPAVGASQDRDPRSPTPGISRTPMRAASSDSVDYLVKQLSEAFGAEAAPPGAACPTEKPAAEEPARQSSPPAGGSEAAAASGEEAERSPSLSVAPARPARVAGPGFSSGKRLLSGVTHRRLCVPGELHGSKPVRRKTNNKIMASSGGTCRSPLSILQDDNSPSAPVPRQGKRHVLGESLGEKKEVTVDLSRSLKSGNCAWSDLNKENQQCPFVEN